MSSKKGIAATGQHPIIYIAEQHIVVCGTPSEGFTFHGPFDTVDDAVTWADVECESDYWVEGLRPADREG